MHTGAEPASVGGGEVRRPEAKQNAKLVYSLFTFCRRKFTRESGAWTVLSENKSEDAVGGVEVPLLPQFWVRH